MPSSLVPCRHCRRPLFDDEERCPFCKAELRAGVAVTLAAGVLLGALQGVPEAQAASGAPEDRAAQHTARDGGAPRPPPHRNPPPPPRPPHRTQRRRAHPPRERPPEMDYGIMVSPELNKPERS